MRALLSIAFRNLLQARRRTLLLAFAIAFVTMLLIVLGGISQGLNDTLVRNATAMASGHVNVAGWYKNKATDSWPMINGAAEVRRIATEQTPGVAAIVDRDRAWAKVISRQGSFYVSPSGIDIGEEARLKDVVQLAKESDYREGGRDEVIGDLERLSEPETALIFAGQAKRLGVTVGDTITLTAPTGSGRTNTVDVMVVAVGRDFGFMSNWNLFVPKSAIKSLYMTDDDTTSVVMIYLDEPSRAEEVMGELREVYARAGYEVMDHDPQAFFFKFESVAGEDWTGQRLDLTVWSDEVSYLSWISTALDAITVILVGILMIIIAIGIMNAMWMSVRKRTVEIGTSRAIGMTRAAVLMLFIFEALMLGLIATTIGALTGADVAARLDAAALPVPDEAMAAILMSDTLQLTVTPGQVILAIVVFTIVTGVSAISPAVRASRLEPVTAIHHSG